jgi:muramoyltetrapeptide carboxypeptidase LdcA involved in peptidoglycan recycling
MKILTQFLLESVKELETCIDDIRQTICESRDEDFPKDLDRVNFYDDIVDKILNEISLIEHSRSEVDEFDTDQSLKRITQLSNFIKNDIVDVILTLQTGFDSNQNADTWN